jgi:sporulation protein YlmC with PRC-barrel domain
MRDLEPLAYGKQHTFGGDAMTTIKLSAIFGISGAISLMVAGATAQPGGAGDSNNRAGPSASRQERVHTPPMPLADWSYKRVYNGWYADGVLGQPIFGPHGDEIGEVKNLLLNPRGEIVALIAEVGGFFEIADTHVTIPWREVERRDGKVYSPITVETAENYGMFAEEYFTAEDVGHFQGVNDFFETGPNIWKASALLDDYVVLENGEPFGYVTDLVFDDAGKLLSVVAAESRGDIDRRGVYAFPWDDRGWRPGFDHYTLRHTEKDIAWLPKIDYSEFDLGS